MDTDVFSSVFMVSHDLSPQVSAWRRVLLVIAAHAELRARCSREGHPLHERIHMGDAWVAASALGHDFPLLAGDHIYHGCPSLRLLEVPED